MIKPEAGPEKKSLVASDWPSSPGGWASTLVVGAFSGIDCVIFSVVIGTLLFSGPLAAGTGLAVTASIISTFIIGVTIAIFSQIRSNIAHVQDVGVAVLAQALAVMVTTQAMPEEVRVPTAMVVVMLTTLSSALLLWATGALGWGGIARFFPQSVLAGFLAGTGWLLAAGGVSVVTGIAISDLFLPKSWSAEIFVALAPAFLFGLLSFITMRRFAWKGTLITFIFAGVVGFHLLLWLKGMSIAEAQAKGWLPHVDSAASGFPNLVAMVGIADWAVAMTALPAIVTAAFLSVIGTLLNTSALATISEQEADSDRELRIHGYANLAISFFAGPPAYTAISSSLVVLRAGVTLRGAGLVMAAVALVGLFNVSTLTLILPVYVTAGLIIYLGIDFLYDWLILTQRHYSRSEWAVVVIILAIVIMFGFAEAIVAGLLIASLIFAWNYASVPVLRRTGSLRDRSSSLARSPAEAAWLRAHGAKVEVIELQGFMFFGTADRLYGHVRDRIADKTRPALSQLIIDFQHVVGLDAAAAAQLTRIVSVAAQHRFKLTFSGYPHNVLTTLTRAAPLLLAEGGANSLHSLDEALEAAEDAVLADAPVDEASPTMLQRLDPAPADVPHLERLFAMLPQETYVKGTVIMPAGAVADSLVFLESGRVAIRAPSPKGNGRRLRAMSSGAVIGDIGVALQTTRTADVIADTDVILRRLTITDMQRIEETDAPLGHALLRLQRRSLAEKIVFDESQVVRS
jgi:sulfate permease, SulP family